jgi:hypothetical protein
MALSQSQRVPMAMAPPPSRQSRPAASSSISLPLPGVGEAKRPTVAALLADALLRCTEGRTTGVVMTFRSGRKIDHDTYWSMTIQTEDNKGMIIVLVCHLTHLTTYCSTHL